MFCCWRLFVFATYSITACCCCLSRIRGTCFLATALLCLAPLLDRTPRRWVWLSVGCLLVILLGLTLPNKRTSATTQLEIFAYLSTRCIEIPGEDMFKKCWRTVLSVVLSEQTNSGTQGSLSCNHVASE